MKANKSVMQSMMLLAIAASALILAGASSWIKGDASDAPASKDQWDRRETTAYPDWPPVEPFVFNVAVTQVEGGWHVTWEAQLTGDYNQDGVVSILDQTPLAAHFNEAVADKPSLIVIDGNDDGVVNILDLTDLASHFLMEMVGFEVAVTEDPEQYPYSTVATIRFSQHELPVEGRLEYETDIVTDVTTGYLRVSSLMYPIEEWISEETVPLPGTE